jgi:hypothetical protein
MLESSKNFDINHIEEKVLNQVCIGLYQLALHFDSDISVSCGSKMYILEDGGTKQIVFPPYSESCGILKLLGEKTRKVQLDQEETLYITFQSNITLVIERDNEGYESFEIWIGNDFLIV